jgi:hypothetical protein
MIQRWGSFSGRQRYRCTSCLRTFSDLTGTHLARLRHLGAWTAFLQAHLERHSVRATAVRCGIHRDTAFRWRHRLLAAVKAQHWQEFEGRGDRVLAVAEFLVPYSRKGQAIRVPPGPPPRKRGIPHGRRYLFPKASVLLLARPPRMARAGAPPSARRAHGRHLVPGRQPSTPRTGLFTVFDVAVESGRSRRPLPSLADALMGLIGRAGDLQVPPQDRLRFEGILNQRGPCRTRGRSTRPVRSPVRRRVDPLPEAWREELAGLWPAFLRWSRRFHGISTRYLDHYLHWHRSWREGTSQREVIARCAPPGLRRDAGSQRHRRAAGSPLA